MARPLSEEKREAILTAATTLVATVGTGATTAKIAKAAGLSEGALFTYFPSKDDLLNALYVELETELSRVLMAAFPREGAPRERVRHVWDSFVDWGAKDPMKRRAIRQLKASDRITAESKRCGEGLFKEIGSVLEASFASHVPADMSLDLVHASLDALADVAMDLTVNDPSRAAVYRQDGFELFWKGIAA